MNLLRHNYLSNEEYLSNYSIYDTFNYITNNAILCLLLTTFYFYKLDNFLFKYIGCKKATFFLNHTIHNSIIVYLTYSDMLKTVLYPIKSMSGEYSLLPTYIHMGFHISHLIIGKNNLSYIDLVHHLGSSCLMGILNVSYRSGPILNYVIFFATGLPGGIDYFMLFLVKMDIIESFTEKKYNRILNTYCRVPCILIWVGIFWTCYRSGEVPMIENEYGEYVNESPLYVILLHIFFIAGNALFFGDRVVISYAHKLQKQYKSNNP
jgi:hypothetical protein